LRDSVTELLCRFAHNMNITHVLLNNGQLGKITKEIVTDPDLI